MIRKLKSGGWGGSAGGESLTEQQQREPVKAFTHQMQFFFFFFVEIIHRKRIIFWLSDWTGVYLQGMRNENEKKNDPFYFLDWGWFYWTCTLRTNTSANHNGCEEQASCPSLTTLPSMADKLLVSLSKIILKAAYTGRVLLVLLFLTLFIYFFEFLSNIKTFLEFLTTVRPDQVKIAIPWLLTALHTGS